MSIDALLAYQQQQLATIVCQNMTDSVLVIASDPRRTHEVAFEGRNSPSGGDYQHMPREIVATPAFARQIALGTLKVVEGAEDPLVQSAMQRQSDSYWKRAEKDAAAALETLDHVADNDYLVQSCFAPGTRAGAACGADIPVKASEAQVKPPLCDKHAHLTDRCIRRGTGPWQLEEDLS
jgi:hypothetical protein